MLGINIHSKHQGCFLRKEIKHKVFFLLCIAHILKETSAVTSPQIYEVDQCEENEKNMAFMSTGKLLLS